MNVSEILEKSAELQGRFVEVQGFFVLVGKDSYFVDSIDDRDNKERALRIDVPKIKEIAMRHVPPSGGSKYYYLDSAVVSGTLERCVEGDFRYAIVSVVGLTITKLGANFVAI